MDKSKLVGLLVVFLLGSALLVQSAQANDGHDEPHCPTDPSTITEVNPEGEPFRYMEVNGVGQCIVDLSAMYLTVAWDVYGPGNSHPVEPDPAPVMIPHRPGETTKSVTARQNQRITYHWDTNDDGMVNTDQDGNHTEQTITAQGGSTGSNIHPDDGPCDRYCMSLIHGCHSAGMTMIWSEDGSPKMCVGG
ncbi:MAG: hypothetical protein OXH29_00155 [bacterium]|nr:hypothetical protein [bacterium]